jgi:hypothetical protein
MTDELPLQFPALALIPDYGAWAKEGLEMVEHFMTEEEFTQVDGWDLKHKPLLAMLVVDAAGMCWRVQSWTKAGVAGRGLLKLLRFIVRSCLVVRYEMVRAPTVPFEEVRRRVCESIQAHPDIYRDDEAIAGEAGPPRDEREMLDELTDKARAASNMRELIGVLEVDRYS